MNIAIIAHDKKKELMVQFCIAYCGIMSKHNICATGTTGKLVSEATGLEVKRFLSGPQGIQIIENPKGPAGKELVLFRDSFGSSLAPLLVEGYSKITLVDLRYVFSHTLEQYVDFRDQDVLFLYSSLLLNNSLALK